MRCIALALIGLAGSLQAAFAADTPAKAPAYRPATALSYDWSATYSGLNLGSSWTRPDLNAGNAPADSKAFPANRAFITPTQPGFNSASFGGGYQLGYNWLRGQWLVGVDVSSTPMSRAFGFNAGPITPASANIMADSQASTGYLTTLKPRVGYVSDHWTVYGTGGFTASSSKFDDNIGAANAAGTGAFGTLGSGARLGWTVGAGTEWVVVPNWTAKVEYLYVDLGRGAATAPLAGTTNASSADSFTSRFTANIIRFGLNYQFTGWK